MNFLKVFFFYQNSLEISNLTHYVHSIRNQDIGILSILDEKGYLIFLMHNLLDSLQIWEQRRFTQKSCVLSQYSTVYLASLYNFMYNVHVDLIRNAQLLILFQNQIRTYMRLPGTFPLLCQFYPIFLIIYLLNLLYSLILMLYTYS